MLADGRLCRQLLTGCQIVCEIRGGVKEHSTKIGFITALLTLKFQHPSHHDNLYFIFPQKFQVQCSLEHKSDPLYS